MSNQAMQETPMDHPRIEEEQILDRYLAGRLSEEEEALFEEHLFACRSCLEQAKAGEELRRGVRVVAAEDAARATAAVGLLAWLRGRSATVRGALAALALGFVLLPVVVVWQYLELQRVQEAARQAAQAPPSPPEVPMVPAEKGLREPLSAFQVVSLGVVRDAVGESPVLHPDPQSQALLLSLELPAVAASRYRVTLRSVSEGDGEILWQGDDLEPNLYQTLLVALPSSYLPPGAYRVTVEALTSTGPEPAGELAFRVAAKNGGG